MNEIERLMRDLCAVGYLTTIVLCPLFPRRPFVAVAHLTNTGARMATTYGGTPLSALKKLKKALAE